ncbi:hypothetical protein B0G76_3232 [Paraburkholderia sp. BL23I1N1]|uniref:hypothetical protein n=1 Tax=Paraburkholderia sp. BL23I1N1 TaxID=1938802 RepID=UPI000E744FB9|nr:hypothetical protein [Paraburkholderia sp. BL23I1N1]RKE37006.1 hypothetical protein B0G76_3232 [Paraburkholderia sp. BL23I1N1]
MSERLWCVHIEGLNDFIVADSQRAAEHEASAINAYLDSAETGPRATVLRAVVVEWPFDAADHARALEEDWRDLQQMPHRRPSVKKSDGVFVNMARRVKKLVSVARSK